MPAGGLRERIEQSRPITACLEGTRFEQRMRAGRPAVPLGPDAYGVVSMLVRRLAVTLIILGGLSLVWSAQSSFGLSSSAANRIANGGAEAGETAPWISSGWGVARYGSAAAPGNEFAELWQFGARGSYLFVASAPSATLEQDVSLEDLAESIEAGTQQLYFELMLGGQSDGGSATAIVTFLDAHTRQVGSPVQLGPIAAGDLSTQPTLLSCEATLNVPVGSRTARVTIDGAAGAPASIAATTAASSEACGTWRSPTSSRSQRRSASLRHSYLRGLRRSTAIGSKIPSC